MPSLAQTAKLSRHSKECPAPVAQRIEHLTTDQKVGGSNPSGRASFIPVTAPGHLVFLGFGVANRSHRTLK